MKALEIEYAHDDRGERNGIRALVWDIDETPPHRRLLIDIFECEKAADAARYALTQHPDTTLAMSKECVARPDEISVSECARAMAGIW